jgi:hypothetical protein
LNKLSNWIVSKLKAARDRITSEMLARLACWFCVAGLLGVLALWSWLSSMAFRGVAGCN